MGWIPAQSRVCCLGFHSIGVAQRPPRWALRQTNAAQRTEKTVVGESPEDVVLAGGYVKRQTSHGQSGPRSDVGRALGMGGAGFEQRGGGAWSQGADGEGPAWCKLCTVGGGSELEDVVVAVPAVVEEAEHRALDDPAVLVQLCRERGQPWRGGGDKTHGGDGGRLVVPIHGAPHFRAVGGLWRGVAHHPTSCTNPGPKRELLTLQPEQGQGHHG